MKHEGKKLLEQQRAQHALKAVYEAEKHFEGEDRQRFVAYVESLPAAIITNGLGQAAATLLAQAKGKKDSPHRKIFDIIQDWLCRSDHQAPYKDADKLMDAITSNDRALYLKAQMETLAYLEWLKRFTVAFLKDRD
ncbi:MAG: type III-B CRISPR module-associated protein Cmr5 [Bacillota bacterium]